jgi:tryptophanyl-tRNA synthetase
LDGEGKMSKSENQMATLYLADEDDAIRKKIMKAKTDNGPTESNSAKPGYIENLFLLMKLVSTKDTLEYFEQKFNDCSIRYGDMKKQLAEDMVQFISPIRQKVNDILNDETYLQKVMKLGAEKAIANAEITMTEVRNAMGLNYFG